MHSGALKLPKKAPSAGIQLPKRQSQSIGELTAFIVTPSLAIKEASLIEVCSMPFRYSTELYKPRSSVPALTLLLMKATPAMERDAPAFELA